MPHLVVRGVQADSLSPLTPKLIKQLADLCDCGTDNFTLHLLHTTAIPVDDTPQTPFALVEVGWFERGALVRNRFAQLITETLQSLDIPEVEVVFIAYRPTDYYVNGSPVAGDDTSS